MTRITLGLALGLLGGTAMAGAATAQTPPAPPPALKQPAAGPATPPAPNPGPQAAPQTPPGQQNAAGGPPAIPTPSGPPEGMIVETPNGFYLVRPGEGAPQRLDIQPRGPRMGQNAGPDDDEAMGAMDQEGLQPPPPPHPHGPPPHPPEGKGAHFRIRTPNMNIDVKCPDDEPMKACADAVAALVDKLAPPAH